MIFYKQFDLSLANLPKGIPFSPAFALNTLTFCSNGDDCSGADRCQRQMKGGEAGAAFCFSRPRPRGRRKAAKATRAPAAETGRSCWGRGQQDASDSEADAGSRNPGSVTEGDGEGLRQQIPVIPAVHLTAVGNDKTAGKGIVQAVLILRADGGPDAHDAGPDKGQRRFQQLLLAVAAADHHDLDGCRRRGADFALLHRSRHRRCGRSGLRRKNIVFRFHAAIFAHPLRVTIGAYFGAAHPSRAARCPKPPCLKSKNRNK